MLPSALATALVCITAATAVDLATSLPAAFREAPVRIADFAFGPAQTTVKLGDTVEWTNADPFAHVVAADSQAWTSPELGPGQRFVLVPRDTGRFPYHCAAHPVMRGVLVVTR